MINIFVSYSHRNSYWLDKNDEFNLIPFLEDSLKWQKVKFWYDHDLRTLPGIEYEDKINKEIDKSQLAILLLSRDFINSSFIMEKELPKIKARLEENKISLIPILVEPWTMPVNHPASWLIKTQIIPGMPTPLINFTDSKRKFLNERNGILQSIERIIEGLQTSLVINAKGAEKEEDKKEKQNTANTKLSDTEQNLKRFAKAAKQNPKNPIAFRKMGETLFELEKYNEAIENLTKAIELQQEDDIAFYIRGKSFYELKEYDIALADFDNAIDLNKNQDYFFYRGLIFEKKSEYQKAIVEYNEAIKLNASFTSAFNNRGVMYQRLGKQREALEDYTRAIQQVPTGSTYYNNRGKVYFNLKDYDKAIEDFNKALELKSDYFWAHYNLAYLYDKLNKNDLALEFYSKAIEIKPDDLDAIKAKAKLLFWNIKNYNEAEKLINRWMELSPNDNEAIILRGKLYINMEKYELAEFDLYSALMVDTENNDILAHLGVTYNYLKQYSKAIKYLTKAIDIEPTSFSIFQRGETYFNNNELELAEMDFKEVLTLEPVTVVRLANSYLYLGQISMKREDFNKAIEYFSNAINKSPDWKGYYFERGKSYMELDQKEKALADFEKADELGDAKAKSWIEKIKNVN